MNEIYSRKDTTGLYLVTNGLEERWELFYKKPSLGRGILITLCYPIGIITYSLCLPLRIMGIFKETALLLKSFFDCCMGKFDEDSNYNFKAQSFIFGMSFVEFMSGLVGLVCPPLAYKIDRYVYSYEIIRNASLINPTWDRTGRPLTAKEKEENNKLLRGAGKAIWNNI